MFSKRELVDAINECEKTPSDYADCERLATFYTIYDHLYSDAKPAEVTEERVIGNYGDSEFLKAVEGCKPADVWPIVDDLMNTMEVMHPQLYNKILIQIDKIK